MNFESYSDPSLANIHDNTYEKISPTAWPVAYCRTFSDIPYSRDIFDAIKKIHKDSPTKQKQEQEVNVSLAPQFEAQYKLIDKYIKDSGVDQVLELASGLSPRGYIFTKDPRYTFVELDLSEMMKDKREIIDTLRISEREEDPRKNLFLDTGNVLNPIDLSYATTHFDEGKKIAITNEGLLRYLDFDEKKIVAENVKALLKKFGGVWITPDISAMYVTKKDPVVAQKRAEEISQKVGRNIHKNLFESPGEAKKFFEDLGFSVEVHSFNEVRDDLVSPAKLGLQDTHVDELIGTAVLFVMKLKEE